MLPKLPAPALSRAGWRSGYRWVIPGSMLLLYGVLAALWRSGPHWLYFGILRFFGFRPFRFPFLDLQAVLSAAQCRRAGMDVYLSNPCDALGRPHVYSPLWLRITPSFLDIGATTAVGLGLGLLFIASLAALCRPTTRVELAMLGLTVLSPMTVYALERANNDLFVFLLILAGCGLSRVSPPWRLTAYAIYFFAGLLKYYPLILLMFLARERRREAIMGAAVAGSLTLFLVISNHPELAKALANIPSLSHFADSFAAANLPFGLAGLLTSMPVSRAIGIFLLAALLGLAAARTRRTLLQLECSPRDWGTFDIDCLVVGALLVTACFFAAQNVDYRGIYFVLVMPGLVELRRRTVRGTRARRFFGGMIAGVLLVAWEPVFRRIVAAAIAPIPIEALRPRFEALIWLGRELVWWWLIAGLAAIVLCYFRQLPLVIGATTRLVDLWPQRRELPG